jgi:electron transport complex protein RnfA
MFPKARDLRKQFFAFTAYDGLVPVSLLITLALADTFAGAAVLALFFALGNLMAIIILNEIRRRSSLEWVPRFLRGSPLILISMGLLSLIFASAAGICFKILEMF